MQYEKPYKIVRKIYCQGDIINNSDIKGIWSCNSFS